MPRGPIAASLSSRTTNHGKKRRRKGERLIIIRIKKQEFKRTFELEREHREY